MDSALDSLKAFIDSGLSKASDEDVIAKLNEVKSLPNDNAVKQTLEKEVLRRIYRPRNREDRDGVATTLNELDVSRGHHNVTKTFNK